MDTHVGQHQGRLVAQYRAYLHMSQQDLADAMHLSLRTVQRMEQEPMIKDPFRRRLLVALPGIPAAALGLDQAQQKIAKSFLIFNDDPMSFLEETVANRWKIHLMGGPLSAAHGLDRVVREVETFAYKMRGKEWHPRVQTQLCLTYQLHGSVLGDMMQYEAALEQYRLASVVAKELEDSELQSAVRVREGIVLMRQEKPLVAITKFNQALHLINGQGFSHLRGNVLGVLSEAHAQVGQAQECWRAIGLAEHMLGQQRSSGERSHRLLSAARVTAHKGVDALLLHDYDRALKLINKSLKTYNPTLTPGRARLLARKAEAYYGLKQISDCTDVAEEALRLAQSVGASNTITRIKGLHAALAQSRWKREASVIHLGVLLTEQ